jgi:UDP-N-acetyl-D-galactosamine dehydrogenase
MNSSRIAIIGLGYVGLPLAVEFAKKYQVTGFDISDDRIKELSNGYDRTLEVHDSELKSTSMKFSNNLEDIKECNVFIVTVPTPIDSHKQPDLTPLIKASETVGKVLKKNDIVIYESTVYPGCTEEDCVPVLERTSGLKFNKDFFCGYSPERINPGDKDRTVTKILKVTSGSNPETADAVNNLYSSVITAGTFKASSIKVAEAAKVIENSQRDINIAFVNELSLIFNKMNLDTKEVLEAAGTKWNFLKFSPGLVGGHCIGVDPYYLTHKAEALGYHPQVILSGRRINDGMGAYVANQVVKLMIKKNHQIQDAKVLILGLTFKENCPDIRNTRVVDIVTEMKEFGCEVDLYDPWADPKEVQHEYHLQMKSAEVLSKLNTYSAVILAVSHKQFLELNVGDLKNSKTVFYDLKGLFPKDLSDGRL